MDEIGQRMMKIHEEGFYCSQIMVRMGLDNLGQENPQLVAAMEGLKAGFAYAGKTCGALTGAIGLLGLYAGRGGADQEPHPALDPMVLELVDWFETQFGSKYGGIDCEKITSGRHDDEAKKNCQVVVYFTYRQTLDILSRRGFAQDGSSLDDRRAVA
jgi:C_GCAxxG_C_C family probable redox protein